MAKPKAKAVSKVKAKAADKAAPKAELVVGSTVKVICTFEGDSKSPDTRMLHVGDSGTVKRIDGDGDASINFGTGDQWVFKKHFSKLQVVAPEAPQTRHVPTPPQPPLWRRSWLSTAPTETAAISHVEFTGFEGHMFYFLNQKYYQDKSKGVDTFWSLDNTYVLCRIHTKLSKWYGIPWYWQSKWYWGIQTAGNFDKSVGNWVAACASGNFEDTEAWHIWVKVLGLFEDTDKWEKAPKVRAATAYGPQVEVDGRPSARSNQGAGGKLIGAAAFLLNCDLGQLFVKRGATRDGDFFHPPPLDSE